MTRNPFMLACTVACFAGIFVFMPNPKPPLGFNQSTYVATNH
jgi:hypothetical protein